MQEDNDRIELVGPAEAGRGDASPVELALKLFNLYLSNRDWMRANVCGQLDKPYWAVRVELKLDDVQMSEFRQRVDDSGWKVIRAGRDKNNLVLIVGFKCLQDQTSTQPKSHEPHRVFWFNEVD